MNINKKIINKILKKLNLYRWALEQVKYVQDPQRLVFSLSRYKFVERCLRFYGCS